MKRVKNYFLFFLLCFILNKNIFAQSTTDYSEYENSVLEISDQNSTNEYDESALFDLDEYKSHPLNINAAEEADLHQIGLNELQIKNLKDYINTHGELLSIYELQMIDGFNKIIIEQIKPFVVLRGKPDSLSVSDFTKNLKNLFIFRYYQKFSTPIASSNSANDTFLGSNNKLFIHYKATSLDYLQAGFTAEKDEGEELFKGSQKNGFDFYSAYLCIKNIGIVKNLIIGDYRINVGQGLTLATSRYIPYFTQSEFPRKTDQGIKPYNSKVENNFFRGIASTICYKNYESLFFFSQNQVDASLKQTDSCEVNYITSFDESGMHRTEKELQGKDAVKEIVYGARFIYHNNLFKIGTTIFSAHLNKAYVPSEKTYNQYAFKGNINLNYGVDISGIYKNIDYFGECSFSKNKGYAYLAGLTAGVNSRAILTIAYRGYQKDYQNLFAYAFSESGNCSNEKGLLTNIQLKLTDKIIYFTSIDIYSSSWYKYQLNGPSNGHTINIGLSSTIAHKIAAAVFYQQKYYQKNDKSPYLNHVVNFEKQRLKFQFITKLNTFLVLKNRLEIVYSESRNYGYLILQDIHYSFPKNNLKLAFRYALFDTYSFQERIYTYEDDMLYDFSVPFFYQKGTRTYLLCKYALLKNIDLGLKLSQTTTINQENNYIKSTPSKDVEIKMQLCFKF